jgi:hypothetical protein
LIISSNSSDDSNDIYDAPLNEIALINTNATSDSNNIVVAQLNTEDYFFP